MAKSNTLLYVGLAGAAYLLLKPKTTTPVLTSSGYPVVKSPGTSMTNPGQTSANVPAGVDPNALISSTSGLTYGQYAAAQAQNSNIGNPNYNLTDAEAQQYMNNYIDLQQALPYWQKAHVYNTAVEAGRGHWKSNGAAEKRSFLPMTENTAHIYVPAPENSNTSGSGGGKSFISSALGIAGSIISLFGTVVPVLSDYEAEVLITGSAIAKDILPMFRNSHLYPAASDRMNDLLTQYTQ